jgi:preprotein translocase SecE subunit
MATKNKRRPIVKRNKTAETSVREQRDQQAAGKSNRHLVRGFFRWLGMPFAALAGLSIWRAKALRPVRFIVKIIGYILFVPYIVNSVRELRNVTWPNWKQSWRLTFAVLMFALFFGLIVAIADFGLDKLFRKVILNS